MNCLECFYSVFGQCPAGRSHNNAACLMFQKSYFDMTAKELKEAAEKEYKNDLSKAAKLYNARMAVIKNTFGNTSDSEDEFAH